jgi:aminopeptidase
MLNETQLKRYAEVILWGLKTAKKGRLKKDDVVLIRFELKALRLVEILYEKLIELGAHPVHRLIQTPQMEKKSYLLSNSRQLKFIPPGEEALYRNLNGGIYILAPDSLTHLSGIDPIKIASALKARKFLRDILDRREEERLFSWTLCVYPTEELAGHANLSLDEYTKQVAGACFLDRKDSVSHWEEIYQNAQTIKKWLNRMKVKKFHIESDRMDLVVTPGEKRKWIGISGHNIPSFELFMSPDWRGTNGIYYADQPSYRNGNYIQGIRIDFKDGIARRVSAEKGEDFLKKQLAMDGGANKVGEFSLTDKSFSKINRFMANTLYDENFGGKFGNCHIALGASYSDTYSGDPSQLTKELKQDLGFNDSALHWDIVNTEKKRVTAYLLHGKTCTIYDNGSFTY